MAGTAPAAVSPYVASTYDNLISPLYGCRRSTVCYYRGMEDITIECDACGDQFPHHALGSFGWANSLICESCADAIEMEWDLYQQSKHSMDS